MMSLLFSPREALVKQEAAGDASIDELLQPAIGLDPIAEDEEEDDDDEAEVERALVDVQDSDRPSSPKRQKIRPLIDLEGEDTLVAHYTAPAKPVRAISINYTNFSTAKKLPSMSERQRRGVVKNKDKLNTTHDPTVNFQLLSKSDRYAVEHMNLDPYSYSEATTNKDFNTLYRLCIQHGWSSFDQLTISERDKRRDKFNDGQRFNGCDMKRLKTRTGFEAALKKLEKQMCWKAYLGLRKLLIVEKQHDTDYQASKRPVSSAKSRFLAQPCKVVRASTSNVRSNRRSEVRQPTGTRKRTKTSAVRKHRS